MSGNRKLRQGVVYSTKDDFEYYTGENIEQEVLPVEKQLLYIELDRKQRKGKQVTLITGYVGPDDSLNELCRLLKQHCATGGSAKDGEICIQGDMRDKVQAFLTKMSYKTKRKG